MSAVWHQILQTPIAPPIIRVFIIGSFPVNFDFAKIEVESYGPVSSDRSINLENTASKNGNSYNYTKEMRYFWDGGLMSNTPLMH